MKEGAEGARRSSPCGQLGLSQRLAGFKPHNSRVENKWAHSFLVKGGDYLQLL